MNLTPMTANVDFDSGYNIQNNNARRDKIKTFTNFKP